MHLNFLIAFCCFVIGHCQDVPEPDSEEKILAEGEKRLSDHILAFIEHYKQPDPVGLPGTHLPEPYLVPDMTQNVELAKVHFKNTAVYGANKFRILYVNADIGAMEVQAALHIARIQARGNYTMTSFFTRAQGPFTVDITGLKVNAKASLGIERDGKLRAKGMHINLSFTTISVDFKNLGMLGSLFQGIVNTAGSLIFESIKPFILKEAYTKSRVAINEKLEEFAGDLRFPNSISPLDMVVVDVRRKIQETGLDPYRMKDYNKTVSVFTMALRNTWITGASSIQRVGNITMKLENNTAIADVEVGTGLLTGTTQWEISVIQGLVSRAGMASFSVEHITARFVIGQPLDTRKKVQFRDIDLEIGNIQVRFEGTGTLDYAVEFLVNILPNLLRYQIMDAVELPLKEVVQKQFEEFNTEEMIKSKLPEIDAMEENGFKLSSLRNSHVEKELHDEDEFFNF